MMPPLTDEQIWGVPESDLPEPESRDYFDVWPIEGVMGPVEEIVPDSLRINGQPPPDDSIIQGHQDV